MENVLLAIHTLIAIALVGVVLLQRSEGGALGIGGGGGGGGGLFSSRAAGDLLTRATAILGAAFFLTSIALTIVHSDRGSGSILDRMEPAPVTAPGPDSGEAGVPAPLAPAPDEPQVPRPE